MTLDRSPSRVMDHSFNERLFDASSVEYSTEQWFESSVRSAYAYATTRRRLLQLLDLRGHENILEIGCGPGTWTRVVAERAQHVTAVDISQEMIRRASTFVPAGKVDFIHSDVMHAQLDRTFDRVVSLRAIEYVSDTPALISRLAARVAPGGALVIVTKTPVSAWRGRRWLRARTQRGLAMGRSAASIEPANGGAMFMQRISPWTLKRLLQQHGFERLTLHPVIAGLPVLAGIEGDLPLIPERLGPAALRTFNRLGDWLDTLPQLTMRLSLCLTESYAVRAWRPVN
jgi:2-polyprenyl-3-methyl-5-hydroxy-6-metoxy-1,4-benzoquinol methylase